MQLAASHRPHPPPVPPRPSRQVVAEALKKSPRPPCPTRQAPPPPNTKPWRPGDKQNQLKFTPGRTVIYESSRCSENNSCDPVKSQECRGKSERTPANENQRERQQQQLVQSTCTITNGNRNDRENFIELKTEENTLNTIDHFAIAPVNAAGSGVVCGRQIRSLTEAENRKDVVTTQCALQVDRVQGTNGLTRECNTQLSVDEVDTVTDGNKDNLEKVKGTENSGKKLSTSSNISDLRKKKVQVIKKDNENNDNVNDFEDIIKLVSPKKSIVLDEKCSTVVVIDEPERKITFNEDNNNDNIQHQDWLEAGVRYSSTKIMLPGDDSLTERSNELGDEYPDGETDEETQFDLDFSSIRERIAMSSLQGLPPLPRSLSGFNLNEGRRDGCEPPPPPARSSSKTSKGGKTPTQSGSRPSPPGRQLTTLDTQLAVLRKEMFGLRQLDLSLLSQLWSLNESIQEFRQLLQDQEDRAPSPSPSSEEGDDGSYGTHPPPPPRRPAPLLHHHRPPRPPRPLRPPPSDESPSSEEYGAV